MLINSLWLTYNAVVETIETQKTQKFRGHLAPQRSKSHEVPLPPPVWVWYVSAISSLELELLHAIIKSVNYRLFSIKKPVWLRGEIMYK